MELLSKIAKILLIPLIAAMSLAGYSVDTGKTGAAPQFTSARPTTLYGSGINSSATSIRLNSLVTPDGAIITTAQLVGGATNVFYLTIDPATTRKETVSCTAVTQNSDGTATVTGCTRGLTFTYPYTASTTLAISHSGGAAVVLSNSPQLYNDIISYVDNSMAAGTVDASPTAKGVVEISSAAEAAAHAQNGSGNTSAYLALTTNIASSTCLSGATQVLVASTSNGFLDSSCLPTTVTKGLTFVATSTMASTTINLFTPYGCKAYSATSTKALTAQIPPFELSSISITASTTSNDALSFTINGDNTSSYYQVFDGLGSAGTSNISAAQSSLNPALYNASVNEMTIHIRLFNPSTAYKLMDVSALNFSGPGSSAYSTTTKMVWRNNTQASSITLTSNGSLLDSRSKITVCSQTQVF